MELFEALVPAAPQRRGRCGLAANLVTAAAISEPPSEHRLGFHHHQQPDTDTQHGLRFNTRDIQKCGFLVVLGYYYDNNITSLTKNWFCYEAHFKHQQAKRWIWNRFVGVSQEEQVLNL